MSNPHRFSFLGSMMLLASACAAEVNGDGEGDSALDSLAANELRAPAALTSEPGKDVSGLNLGAPCTTYSMPERGGSGGSPAPSLRCAVIYGMQLNTGKRVDRLTLAYYIPSGSDNQYRSGDFFSTLGPLGGGGGSYHDWTYCPPGYGAIGIQGRAGSRVDALGLICAHATTGAGMISTTVYGGGGGQGFYDVCNTNSLMTGVNARSDSELDRIQGVCQAR